MINLIRCEERADPTNNWIVSYSASKERAEETVGILNDNKTYRFWIEEVEEDSEAN